MTTKEKRFPLSLSSVVDQREAGRGDRTGHSASTQTATQNARQGANLATRISAAENGGKKAPEQAVPFASPLVSDGVRRAMVARVAQQGVSDTLVLAALQAIPRHMFLESGLASQAYVDASLPIGHHQTISQPYIVGRMLEILRNGAALDKVLEIGTGCGYQAAVLSLIAKDVYSVERIKALHELAKNNLRPMRIANIRLHYGDGMLGMPQVAPFDGIILAAAGMEVPHALLTQLKIGGRLIAPVGDRHQVLQLIERVSVNDWNSTMVENCHFVPLRSGVI
ncbi:protein-L-isoaspartate(D-aspartate) O-methyltransferase [Undibacterium sp. CY21W]|uniref:protein-L-isoaspartate(D-aspartate) O-methyltransferase n=1 Tax=Undibacterium sp. CY21W TaxID=2762293 RepID=UPI00164C630D|nr:protein-L-isoaspartate(D-aspartate) O-methyltransferase [Undibacterium sp. CY21W]MBC3929678.1 protein-L-isoaspartate(D-aspartate) O-methyltransferase [Undibacterium sp. CY21W]